MKTYPCVSYLRMPGFKKLFFPLLIITWLPLVTGCKKEALVSNTQTAVSSESSNAVTDIKFGAQIGETKTDDNVTVFSKLGVNYVRWEIVVQEFNGRNAAVDTYIDKGYKLLLNLNYGNVRKTGTVRPVPFPKDMALYRSSLQKVLDKYKPEVAVIENEPTTDDYHSGPIEDYITELTNAIDVCKQNGVKVADGGSLLRWVQMLWEGTKHTGTNTGYDETKTLLAAYKTLDLDYVNIHTMAPYAGANQNVYPPGVLEGVANYLRTTTGKEVMCNEYNQDNQSSALMQSAVAAFKAGGYKYMVARSNKGGAGIPEPLNIKTNLTTIGIAYRDAIK